MSISPFHARSFRFCVSLHNFDWSTLAKAIFIFHHNILRKKLFSQYVIFLQGFAKPGCIECITSEKTNFISKCSPGQVQCFSNNPAKNCFLKVLTSFTQNSDKRHLFLQTFFRKSSRHFECSFDCSVKKFSLKDQWNEVMTLYTRRAQFW